MTKFHMLGITLLAALAFSAVAATSAFASPEWLVNSASVSTGETVTIEGTVLLEDMKLGAAVYCLALSVGLVLSGGKDTTNSVVLSSCQNEKGCTLIDSVTASNLPWTTEVVLDEIEGKNKYLDKISADGAGSPGYKVECVVAGLLDADSCTKAEATVELINATNLVDVLFNSGEEAACSLGGEEGLVETPFSSSLEAKTISGLSLAASG